MGILDVNVNLSIDDNSKEIIQNIGKPAFTIMDVIDSIIAIPTALLPYYRDILKCKLEYKKQSQNQFIQKADSKIAKIPVKKRIVPPRNLLGRFAETPEFYYEDEEISEFFANIIASSIDFDKSRTVHPSFVNAVRELSPYDARLIRECLVDNNVLSLCKIRCQKFSSSWNSLENFRRQNAGKDYLMHVLPLNNDYFDITLTSFSLNNLERLGLIYIDYDISTKAIDQYKYMDANHEIVDGINGFYKYSIQPDEEVILCPGALRLTEYGLNFINVCCPPEHQSDY